MYECLFSPNCTEDICDRACPILAQTSYLMSLNSLDIKCPSIRLQKGNPAMFDKAVKFFEKLDSSQSLYGVVKCDSTISAAELITYIGICKHWKGSRLHASVFGLQFSKYIDMMKQSWNYKVESDDLQYLKIWAEQSKLLVISNIDYVNFGDFECQTLLNLLQYREGNHLQTVIVAPKTSLFGKSNFLPVLTSKIDNKKGVNVTL